jgi:hypothetical protein
MSTKINVNRLELIKAIEDKAKSNQAAYDAAVAAAANDVEGSLVTAIKAVIDKQFTSPNTLNRPGYTKGDVQASVTTLLSRLGIKDSAAIPKPNLYEKQLLILKLAKDETLELDMGSEYVTLLQSV